MKNSSDVHGGSSWATSWASPNSKGRIPPLAIPMQLLHAQRAPARPLGTALGSSVEAILVNITWGMVTGNTAGHVVGCSSFWNATSPQPAPVRGLQSADASCGAGRGALCQVESRKLCQLYHTLSLSLAGYMSH